VLTGSTTSTPAARPAAARLSFEQEGRLITPPATGTVGGQASCQAAVFH
jgi:hypothetical protein